MFDVRHSVPEFNITRAIAVYDAHVLRQHVISVPLNPTLDQSRPSEIDRKPLAVQ